MTSKRREVFIRITEALLQPDGTFRSPRAQEEMPTLDYLSALGRHLLGDWGDASAEQTRENEAHVAQQSGRLLSVFRSSTGAVFWVVTEPSWRWTGVMFPEEYAEWVEFHQTEGPELIVH